MFGRRDVLFAFLGKEPVKFRLEPGLQILVLGRSSDVQCSVPGANLRVDQELALAALEFEITLDPVFGKELADFLR